MSTEETLSALLDDEAQELELRRLLSRMDEDPSLLQRWQRFQLARAAMHGEPIVPAQDFLAGVQQRIAGEALPRRQDAWRRTAGGFAVAASVAALVVLGGLQFSPTSQPPATAQVGALPVGPVGPVGAIGGGAAVPVQASFGTQGGMAPATDAAAYRDLARQRLLRYSQEHAEHAALNTPAGMVPFARVPAIEP